MVAVNSSLLIAWLLMSFCKESFEVGGWIEDRAHNLNLYRHLAEFAYADQKTRNTRGMHFRVTQARWKYTEGMRYNIGFIVYNENTMTEKCIAVIQLPPPSRADLTMIVTKFWCRRIP
ncbi:uncharacterized protein LOC142768984 isoform X2 [Rhipicephalus microplus]